VGILHVGDHLDNDIRAAAESGMATALIRRGPCGVIPEHDPAADEIATLRISTLTELPTWIAALNESGPEGR
jgi:FMN phosphatase YigB (HAD superfamily)